jgi:hypothetical protein
MDSKYVSQKPNGVANCPICRGVILRDFRIDSEKCALSFTLRCPHCQGVSRVSIDNGHIAIAEAEKKTS